MNMNMQAPIGYLVVCTDEENDAYLVNGQYKTIAGVVLKVDRRGRIIAIRNGAETHVTAFFDVYRTFKPT